MKLTVDTATSVISRKENVASRSLFRTYPVNCSTNENIHVLLEGGTVGNFIVNSVKIVVSGSVALK